MLRALKVIMGVNNKAMGKGAKTGRTKKPVHIFLQEADFHITVATQHS